MVASIMFNFNLWFEVYELLGECPECAFREVSKLIDRLYNKGALTSSDRTRAYIVASYQKQKAIEKHISVH